MMPMATTKNPRGGMIANHRTRWAAGPALVLAAGALLAAPALAESEHTFGESYGGRADKTPAEIEDVDIEEKTGDDLPLDLPFRDEDGKPIELGELFETGKPVIMTFNYSDCPMLCSVQLGGVVDALRQMDLRLDQQFRIVTVTLDPTESPEIASDTKAHYLERLEGGDDFGEGWRFLTGSKTSIETLTNAVGFEYEYSPERNEYFHAPALVLASPSGKVSSYLYGVRYEPDEISESVTAAAMGDTRESAEKYIMSCFLYDGPGGHAATAFQVMRIGGIGFVLLGGVLGTMYVVKRTRKSRREHQVS